MDAAWAFDQYETVRGRLPAATFPQHTQAVNSLLDLIDEFDVFLLDAFGVLNRGATAIASALRNVKTLQARGKQVMVVTNSASLPACVAQEKYRRLGFDFAPADIIASRDALIAALPRILWAAMAADTARVDLLPADVTLLQDDPAPYDAAQGFLLMGTQSWTDQRQTLLLQSLSKNPRPVLCANPDIVAPTETGLSLQPAFYAHQLDQIAGVRVEFFGKPFGNIFVLALERARSGRILMVGDTLHTDILGGAAAGIKTALVTDHGLFAGEDTRPFVQASGIIPDFVMPSA